MLHTLLIALAIIGSLTAIIIGLIFITKRERSNLKKTLLDNYRIALTEHNIVPDKVQDLEHRILALDTSKKIFVCIQKGIDDSSAIIDLHDVKDCRIWKDGFKLSTDKPVRSSQAEEHTNIVALSFIRKSGIALNVPVYVEAIDGLFEKMPLIRVAEQWQQDIMAAIPGT